MVAEWLEAVFTVEWLLGASMGMAGKRLFAFVQASVNELRKVRSNRRPHNGDPIDPQSETQSES